MLVKQTSGLLDPTVLLARIAQELETAGGDGRTKTELLQASRAPTTQLTAALDSLVAEFKVVMRTARKRGFALGRPVTRYWLTSHAPTDLTVPAPPAIPNSKPEPEPEADPAPASGGACRQCGIAMGRTGPGRVPFYCSSTCERLAKAGGVTTADVLAQARDPHTFARCASLLAQIDLLCRGVEVMPMLGIGGALIVYDRQGNAAVVHVIPISDSGQVPHLGEFRCAVLVYRDGRVAYAGREPLFVEGETG